MPVYCHMLEAAYPCFYTQPVDMYLEDSEQKVACPYFDRDRRNGQICEHNLLIAIFMELIRQEIHSCLFSSSCDPSHECSWEISDHMACYNVQWSTVFCPKRKYTHTNAWTHLERTVCWIILTLYTIIQYCIENCEFEEKVWCLYLQITLIF
jgi:hypothetical protein